MNDDKREGYRQALADARRRWLSSNRMAMLSIEEFNEHIAGPLRAALDAVLATPEEHEMKGYYRLLDNAAAERRSLNCADYPYSSHDPRPSDPANR